MSNRNYQNFWMSWSGYPHAMFEVRACGNALIALTPAVALTTPIMYEVELSLDDNGKKISRIR